MASVVRAEEFGRGEMQFVSTIVENEMKTSNLWLSP